MRIIVLRVDGTEEEHQATLGGYLADVDRLLDNKTGFAHDTVSLLRSGLTERFGMRHPVMLVRGDGYETRTEERFDEKGRLHVQLIPTHARLPLNPKATELYKSIGGPNPIVGDVAIVDDEDFPG